MKYIILIALLTLPVSTLAITKGEIITPQEYGITPVPVQNVPQAVGVLRGVVQTTYIVFFIIATLFILFAAYNYLTAGGQPEKISTVHKQLIYAGIAIAVALLAVGASTIIGNFLGNPAAGGVGGTTGAGGGVQVGKPRLTPLPPGEPGPFGTYPTTPKTQTQTQPSQPIKGPEGSDR